jgi:hypothetical protein
MNTRKKLTFDDFASESYFDIAEDMSGQLWFAQEKVGEDWAGINIGSFVPANITPVLFVNQATKHSEAYFKAVELTNSINQCYSDEAALLLKKCKYLKEILENKLYKVMGFREFKSFCERMLSIGAREAYRYINIINRFSEDFVTANSQNPTKLMLLSSLSDDELKQLESKINLDKVSCSNLKKEIKKIKNEERKETQISKAKIRNLKEKNTMLQAACESYKSVADTWRDCCIRQSDKSFKLRQQLKSNLDSATKCAPEKPRKVNEPYKAVIVKNVSAERELPCKIASVKNENEQTFKEHCKMADCLIEDFKLWLNNLSEEREQYVDKFKKNVMDKMELL